MKLFKTGSAAVVSEWQFFSVLPISNQIDMRTAKFLENFMTSVYNYICRLFECRSKIGLNKILSMYDNARSALDVRRAADRLLFC